MTDKKLYVLDTNILVHDPSSIFGFDNSIIGIPIFVLEELDQFKTEGTDRGRNTRQIIRHLDALRARGSLSDGVELDNGAIVKILFLPDHKLSFPMPFKMNIADNAIIMTAVYFKEQGYQVKFISKDLNARVKSDVLGIPAEDYLRGVISKEQFYRGWRRVRVPAVQLKKDVPEEIEELAQAKELFNNEFILLESQHNPHNNKVFRYLGGTSFRHVEKPYLKWPLEPRNAQQLMAMDLLFDPDIKLLTLLGTAGTGKTFLALLAGLHKVLIEDEYEKILVSRPVIPLGRDIGYLPGTIEEKLHSWMLPIYDNIDFIVHSSTVARQVQAVENEGRDFKDKKRRHPKKIKELKQTMKLRSLQELAAEGKISMEAITYMRGRSIPYQFILIDEAQNLTPHEIKTLVTRVGEGSKIILTGDPYQIDSPYLDFSSNGLVIASDRFKGEKIFGTVFLERSERSELSHLAAELL